MMTLFVEALEREAALLASIEEANRTAEERLQASSLRAPE